MQGGDRSICGSLVLPRVMCVYDAGNVSILIPGSPTACKQCGELVTRWEAWGCHGKQGSSVVKTSGRWAFEDLGLGSQLSILSCRESRPPLSCGTPGCSLQDL